ncbi:hypothetical protein ACRYCC_21315 [Actinomadura scrupuli]|uniref:hypothetical protein n=1 Tax=Actinomadura scrupuli TaxID=559629 RepID=UPI003D99A8D9
MLSTRRLILLASALPVAATIALVEAPQAFAAPGSHEAVGTAAAQALQGRPMDDNWNIGFRAGMRQGVRDGGLDCKNKRSRSTHRHLRSAVPGATMYSRGWAVGYMQGYKSMCPSS